MVLCKQGLGEEVAEEAPAVSLVGCPSGGGGGGVGGFEGELPHAEAEGVLGLEVGGEEEMQAGPGGEEGGGEGELHARGKG